MDKITEQSTIKQVYQHPIGHDVLFKLLLAKGKSEKILFNPLISRLRLKTLKPIINKLMGKDFLPVFLHLMNLEKDKPLDVNEEISPKWWKEAIFYQIYPRSFYDSDQDGFGDIRGIIEKLDYLKDLGVTALWLSPIYESPQDDMGYDISDYRNIYAPFGTMEDFDELLNKAHEKGLRLIMDLVVNHTSDEHEWFQKALKGDLKYRSYYFMKEGEKDVPPNNWTSFFAGSAWRYFSEEKIWALHLFSKKQMDLDWTNPEVREEVYDIVRYWFDKGVDGFRMDVINYISKEEGLPDGDPVIGAMMGYTGIEHYYYGPKLHEYLKELKSRAFTDDKVAIGETPGVGVRMAKLLSSEERRELDMIFSFDHLESPGHARYDIYRYSLDDLRDYLLYTLKEYGSNTRLALFFNNHDNPRMISKIAEHPQQEKRIAVCLAVWQMTFLCTPFLYQGDEMGLGNIAFKDMSEIEDVEGKGFYKTYIENGMNEEEAFKHILAGTRQHTRQLLPWNACSPKDHRKQNVDMDVYNSYKELIALRKQYPALVYGSLKALSTDKGKFTFVREYKGEKIVVDLNISSIARNPYPIEGECLYPHKVHDTVMEPYEGRIIKIKADDKSA